MKKLLLASAFLLPVAANAQDAMNAGILGFKGTATANYEMSNGNTDSTDMGVMVNGKRDWNLWAARVAAQANFGKNNGVRDEENYSIDLQGDRKLDEKSYVFAGVGYEVDNFSGYEYIAEELIGYGRELFKDANKTLNAQIGFGAQQTEDDLGNDSNDFVVKPAADFTWQINDGLSFIQTLESAIASDLTTTKSVSLLKNQLAGNLFLQAGYEIEHRSDVPVGTKETDTKTMLGVAYDF